MDKYQHKRVIGNLKRVEKLLPFELKFLNSIKDKRVVSHLGDDLDPLSDKQAHILNQIAQRVGG